MVPILLVLRSCDFYFGVRLSGRPLCILGVSQLGTSKGAIVQKVLLSMILALFMALAIVGIKRAFAPAGASQSPVLVATGNLPEPT